MHGTSHTARGRRGRLFVLFGVMIFALVGFGFVLNARQARLPPGPEIPVYEGDDVREGLVQDNGAVEDDERAIEEEADGEAELPDVPPEIEEVVPPRKLPDVPQEAKEEVVPPPRKVVRPSPLRVVVDHSDHNHAPGWNQAPNATIGYLARYVKGVGGGTECEDDYGMNYIRRWQSYGKTLCVPPSVDLDAPLPSLTTTWQSSTSAADFHLDTRIRCHSLVPSHQTPEPQSICLAENVAVDFARIAVKMCKGDGCHNDFYDGEKTVFFKPGIVRGRCRPVPSAQGDWNTRTLVKTVGNWLVRGWENLNDQPDVAKELETRVCTKENTVDHFVYFVSRYDTTNLYHASEDWIHAFQAFSVLEVPLERSQVVIADGLVPGPFMEVWKELFSRNHPVLHLADLQKAGQTTCYNYMGINVFAAISPLCKRLSMTTPCFNTTLLRGFRDFALSAYKVKYLLPAKDKFTITIIQRKNYARASAGPVQHISRQIQNHEELVKMTKELFPEATVQSVDFASLSFREQLKLIRTTDILMGAHGAALTHMMFLPTTSAVIEFWIDDRYGNYHYVNMAKWLDLPMFVEHQSNPLNLDDTRAHLLEASKQVALAKEQRRYDH